MKRIAVIILILALITTISVYAFADEDVCELNEDEHIHMLSVKSQFLGHKITQGILSQDEADKIYTELQNKVHNHSMRGLGFGIWLKESKYAEDIMPHKNEVNENERHLGGSRHQGGNNTKKSEHRGRHND
jgi:hypothetical protein